MIELTRVESAVLGGSSHWRGLKYVSVGTKVNMMVENKNREIVEVEVVVAKITRDVNDVHMVMFEPVIVPEGGE
jgi:hypothetical protein